MKIFGAPEFIAVSPASEWRPVSETGAILAGNDGSTAFRLRRASRSRPGDAFLVLGDLEGEGDVRFEDLAEVTWAGERVFDSDLAYRPVKWK